MKIIRTRTRNVILDHDITRIAKSMINVYHGRQLFDEAGALIAGADLELPEDYLMWEEGNFRYRCRPVRGYIYINFLGGVADPAFKSNAVRDALLREFMRLNQWGWRDRVYTEHQCGSNQFTVEACDSTQLALLPDMCVVVGRPFHAKMREYKFTWVISDDSSLYQFTTSGKFPHTYNMVAAMSTIVVDVVHASDLPDGYRCIAFPPLTKDITVVPRTINLSRIVGVSAHLYHILGAPVFDAKCWGSFIPIICPIEAGPMCRITERVHQVKTLADLATVTDKPSGAGDKCTVCRVCVFDKFYQVSRNDNIAVLCKFCAHFNVAAARELATRAYRVAVVTADVTTAQLIESLDMTAAEREVVRQIYRESMAGTLKYADDLTGPYGLRTAFSGLRMCVGAVTMIGILDDQQYAHALDEVHRFPDHTRVFAFNQCLM